MTTKGKSYRDRALSEYGEQCSECGETENIEVHHLNGDRTDNSLDNLLPLCRDCHAKVHGPGLNGLEEQLLPLGERPHIKNGEARKNIKIDAELYEELRKRKNNIQPPTTWDGFIEFELIPAYDEAAGYSTDGQGD